MRVLGIDDAPFNFYDDIVPIVGAVIRCPSYVEGIMTDEVEIDGTDATRTVIEMVNGSRYKEQVRLIMIDGISLGGFNVVDIQDIFSSTGIPVATITRDKPDLAEMKAALRKHFDDWEQRLEILSRAKLVEVSTEHRPIHVDYEGIEFDELVRVIRGCTVLGALPEPLRISHLIATAMVRGESKGDA